jgi:hypothetical protein
MTRRGIPPPEHGRELGPPAVPAACPDACRHEIARPAFRFAKGRLPKICYELGYELRFQILPIGLRSLSPRDQKLITVCQLPDVPSYRRSELGSCRSEVRLRRQADSPNSQPGPPLTWITRCATCPSASASPNRYATCWPAPGHGGSATSTAPFTSSSATASSSCGPASTTRETPPVSFGRHTRFCGNATRGCPGRSMHDRWRNAFVVEQVRLLTLAGQHQCRDQG